MTVVVMVVCILPVDTKRREKKS